MSSHPRFRLKLIVIALTLLYSGLSQAEDVVVNPITPSSLPALSPPENINGNVFFPLYPRLNVTGGMGNNNFGAADVMAPLFGSTDAIVYTDVDGQIGKGQSRRLSFGIGARDAVSDDLMWGGYVFVDRSKSNDADGGAHWTVFNPGAEFMTNQWDGRINAYIPSSDKENVQGPFFGDQVNQPGAISFNQHDKFSHLFEKVEEIGTGLDVDAGYTFTSLKRFRVHGGGYYFQINNFTGSQFLQPIDSTTDIIGGEVGAEMPVNNYLTLQFDDSYDKVEENTAIVSVRFTLGGIDKFANEPTVQDRILDPIYRHLGALRTNTGIPSTTTISQISGPPVLEQSNVWFFNANSGVAFDPAAGNNNCTFEHPCIGTSFNQNNINTINDFDSNANFYFTSGTYPFGSPGRLSLNSGQSMFGRTNGYAMPASSASGFPTFVGGLDPKGNNTLDSFALINNNGSQTAGINIINTNNILMNNLQIGQMNTQGSYQISVQSNNANNITLQNSNLSSVTAAVSGAALVIINNSSNFNLNNNIGIISNSNAAAATNILQTSNSTITANTNNFTARGGNSIGGIVGDNSTVNATGNTITIDNTADVNGALITNGTLNLTGNTFNANNISGGINVFSNNGSGTLSAANNIINVTNSTNTFGAFNLSTGIINLNGNQFNLTGATNGNIVGVNNTGTGTINMTGNNQFTLTTSGSGAITGVNNASTGSINLAGSTFTQNNTASTASNTGISNSGTGTVTATNNTFNITDTGNSSSPIAVGATNNDGTLNLSNNQFNITALNGGVYGFFGHGTLILNSNTFNLNSNVSITGIAYNSNVGSITGSNNTFTLTGTGTNIGGTNLAVAFLSNPANNNTCKINGANC